MTDQPTRRLILGAFALVALVAVAGCAGAFGPSTVDTSLVNPGNATATPTETETHAPPTESSRPPTLTDYPTSTSITVTEQENPPTVNDSNPVGNGHSPTPTTVTATTDTPTTSPPTTTTSTPTPMEYERIDGEGMDEPKSTEGQFDEFYAGNELRVTHAEIPSPDGMAIRAYAFNDETASESDRDRQYLYRSVEVTTTIHITEDLPPHSSLEPGGTLSSTACLGDIYAGEDVVFGEVFDVGRSRVDSYEMTVHTHTGCE